MIRTAERSCVVLLLAYLIWVPLPFGSNVGWTFPILVLPPLILCAVAALLRIRHAAAFHLPRAYSVWSAGAIALIVIVAIQLVPLPANVLSVVSPESHAIWSSADRVVALSRDAVDVPLDHPITVNPNATWLELFRGIALFATFQASALLIYTNRRRIAFASVLGATAMFEVLYGVREAAMRRYAIWGWVNRLIYDRVTGTFVNPNHFAHYLAIALPLAAYPGLVAWRLARGHQPEITLRRHVARLLERDLLLFSVSLAACVACVAGILVSQSRGALAALAAGGAIVIALVTPRLRGATASRRRRATRAARRVAFAAAGFLLFLAALVSFLGSERTAVARIRAEGQQQSTLGGRRIGIEAALRLWRLFPLFGSGAGTFADVVSMTQTEDLSKLYQHAHDDYAELAATTGAFGFLAGAGAFFAGLLLNFRRYLNPLSVMSWRGRTFGLAALASVAIASLHALVDFNFFIPANAATILAIAGAATSPRLKAVPAAERAVADVHPA
jgi:putative inorganic carbon (HCO3(-)) transporter